MEKAVSNSILRGRPFGGVAILVHNDYLKYVSCLHASERFVVMNFHKTLLINVYLPCSTSDSEDIVHGILAEIGGIINLYQGYDIIFGCDFNIDLTITSNRSKMIREFINDCKMSLVSDIIKPKCLYTYCHESMQHYSMVDHFMISNAVVE